MDLTLAAQRLVDNVAHVIDGKREAIQAAVITLLAEGHLLIEDVPGVGKTALARALAVSSGSSVRRIQFTPDLLPSDITGVSVFNQSAREFEFKPGPVFANLLIGDEINRSSPKTQSALLEAMEEHQVTVDGKTYALAQPFMVIATQNPYDMEGTYPLPEAQRDRFMMRIDIGYPDIDAEIAMIRDRNLTDPISRLSAVVSTAELRSMIQTAQATHVSAGLESYVVQIVQATRRHPDIRLGASPRATLQLVRAAKAYAAMQGRAFVIPDDVDALATLVIPHRLIAARPSVDTAAVTRKIVAETPVPAGQQHRR